MKKATTALFLVASPLLFAAETWKAPKIVDSGSLGTAGNSRFVFCDDGDCPERTIKHIAESPRKVAPPPGPISITPPIEIQKVVTIENQQEKQKKKPKKKKRKPRKQVICRDQ
jgi:hypothetical protein